MSDDQVYRDFIKWAGQSWWELPESVFGKAVAIDEDLWLGCGVCVHKCPNGSLTLERCDEIKPPPETARDYMQAYMTDRLTAKKDGKKTRRTETKEKRSSTDG